MRKMDRARKAMPIGNKQCYARHVKANQDKHRRNLASMKCSIDNKPPQTFAHLQRNQKKEQMMEERYAEIERDNRLLLEKMSGIMRKNNMDMRNDSMQYGRSLGKDIRRKELKKISKENLEILRRIQNAEPTYDHFAWQDDARKHEVYMKNICELPLAIGPASISVQEMRRAALRG